MRKLKHKFFLGSTIEEIDFQLDQFLTDTNMCPGNLVDYTLYKHGSVYQYDLWYAVFVPPVK
jgi:hypothetical protein